MVNNPYPERSDAVIEELANRLHAEYLAHDALPLNLPVPVEEIAEQFLGYEIDFSETGIFSDPDILGGIDFEKNKIYVNASVADHDGRYSFTVAHELGHTKPKSFSWWVGRLNLFSVLYLHFTTEHNFTQ